MEETGSCNPGKGHQQCRHQERDEEVQREGHPCRLEPPVGGAPVRTPVASEVYCGGTGRYHPQCADDQADQRREDRGERSMPGVLLIWIGKPQPLASL